MRTSCLINNYNYGQYIREAVDSALNQTVGFDEIIVVDDCSTDDSAQILLENYGSHAQVKLVLKPANGGQLSSFNEGFRHATGDLIFFLDADDLYEPNYLEESLRFYDSHPGCDFLFCAYTEFGASEKVVKKYVADRDLGYSAVRALYSKTWIGSITSTVSMRRSVLERFLPIPYEQDWRIRADDCLVWGSSIAGARKFFFCAPLVKRRIHDKNGFAGAITQRATDRVYEYKRVMNKNRLFEWIRQQVNYPSYGIDLLEFEFRTIPQPTRREFNAYLDLILYSKLSLSRKFKLLQSVLKHFLSTRKQERV